MENPIKMDDLGVPLFSETSQRTLRKRQSHLHYSIPTHPSPGLHAGSNRKVEGLNEKNVIQLLMTPQKPEF